MEVDSRLSVKCTCHQTSAKVKYSSLYVHNMQQPSLDMRRLRRHYDNSSLMSKCKHHLMDSSVMRETLLAQYAGKTTSLMSRFDVTAKDEEKKIITQHFVWFSWWDDQDMASYMFRETRNSVCYDGASLLSSCIILKLGYRRWQGMRENLGSGVRFTQKIIRKTKAMTPWFKPFKNIMSALWNPSSCRQF